MLNDTYGSVDSLERSPMVRMHDDLDRRPDIGGDHVTFVPTS